jgi:hypothetical protein
MDLSNEILWKTTFSWEDVVACLPDDTRDAFESLTEEQKKALIEKHTHSLGKGLEAGIMNDWTVVMNTAIDNVNLVADIEGMKNRKSDIECLTKVKGLFVEVLKALDSLSEEIHYDLVEYYGDYRCLSNCEPTVKDTIDDINKLIKHLEEEK